MRETIHSLAALAVPLLLAAGAARAGTFQQQVAADPRGEVDVSNVAGTIAVSGWDQPQVAVSADLASDSQRIEVTSEHGRTSVRVIGMSHDDWFGGSGVRLTVHVPRQSEVDVSAVSADITSHDVAGTQRLHSVSGEITADLGSGDDEVKSVSGEIRLRGSGRPGLLHVSSVSGDVSLTNAAGELEATTISGTLRAQFAPAQSLRVHTTSGDVTIDTRLGSGGTLEAESVSGELRLKVGAQAGYQYEVGTFSGDIEDCFGRLPERTSRYAPGKRLDGTWGAGSGRIHVRSLSGDVSLCDH